MARKPGLLLADEPTMHLDAGHIRRLEEQLASGSYAEYTERRQRNAAKKERPDGEAELLAVETKLSEVLGRMGMTGPRAPDLEELDRQFRLLADRRNELRRRLGETYD